MKSATLRVAAAQYDIGFLKNWAAYEEKVTRWVDEAARAGAQLLLFPEYHSLELASLFPEEVYRSLPKQLDALQTRRADFLALYQRLAEERRVIIVAGSFPVRLKDGTVRNRSDVFHPGRAPAHQDKLIMTRFENERWNVAPGRGLTPIDTDWGPVAVNICYDSEFPLLARRAVEAGAWLILVPSCTDTPAGYHRVRIGCQARALENQCYVVQAPTVGNAPWSEAVDVNVGAAGVYTPPDVGFPDDGILAQGAMNAPQWLYADLHPARVDSVRRHGQVVNHRDWPRQFDGPG